VVRQPWKDAADRSEDRPVEPGTGVRMIARDAAESNSSPSQSLRSVEADPADRTPGTGARPIARVARNSRGTAIKAIRSGRCFDHTWAKRANARALAVLQAAQTPIGRRIGQQVVSGGH